MRGREARKVARRAPSIHDQKQAVSHVSDAHIGIRPSKSLKVLGRRGSEVQGSHGGMHSGEPNKYLAKR